MNIFFHINLHFHLKYSYYLLCVGQNGLSANDAIRETIQDGKGAGESSQFYKVNEVAKSSLFAACANILQCSAEAMRLLGGSARSCGC